MKARHVFWLLVGIAIGLLIWRPDWRDRLVRAATPVARQGVQAAWERIRAWRPWEKKQTVLVARNAPAESREAVPDATAEAPVASPEPDSTPIPGGESYGPPQPENEPIGPAGNLPPRLPRVAAAPPLPARLRSLAARARGSRSPVVWRRLADTAAEAGVHAVAAEAYLKEAAIYRRQGDPNAAAVETLKAGRHSTEGGLYLHASPAPDAKGKGLARLEPDYGCMVGAFIDHDDQLPTTFLDETWQTHREPTEFEELVGKKHASYFWYLRFGRPFPFKWSERLRRQGIVPHIAWEPHQGLGEVDESTVGRFADELARFDAPIFIRFAGEMNGNWTRYHGNPALYREKFRMVHRILSSRAPKAALVWCVNTVPEGNIEAYYPGNDAVDWVGVNMYNVLYFDNDRSRPADQVHPADLLSGVYRKYAARKPIAICEYAASHQAACDPQPRPELAVRKISQLYAALPRLFPRVKLVDWFDCNNLKHARAGRQLNNYSLTENASVLNAYRRMVSPSYFLGRSDERPEEQIRPLKKEEPLEGVVTLSAWVRAPITRPRVYVTAGDQVLFAGDEPGEIVCRWDTRKVQPGRYPVRLLVLDREGRKILEQEQGVRVHP